MSISKKTTGSISLFHSAACIFAAAFLLPLTAVPAGGPREPVDRDLQTGSRVAARVTADLDGKDRTEALSQLETLSGQKILFRRKDIPSGAIQLRLNNLRLSHALSAVLQDTGLTWTAFEGGVRVHPVKENTNAALASPVRTGLEYGALAQADRERANWWDADDNDEDDDRYGVRRRAVVPAKTLYERASSLESLITNVIEPGRWRRPDREPDPDETDDDTWW